MFVSSTFEFLLAYCADIIIKQFRDQDDRIFHDKAVMQLGFETLRMKGLKKMKNPLLIYYL